MKAIHYLGLGWFSLIIGISLAGTITGTVMSFTAVIISIYARKLSTKEQKEKK